MLQCRPSHGYMHGNICDTYQVHDVDEEKQRLTKVWHGLGQSVIDDESTKRISGTNICGRVFMSKEGILRI